MSRSHARAAVASRVRVCILSCWKFIQSCSYVASRQPRSRARPKRWSQKARPRGTAKPVARSISNGHSPPFCRAYGVDADQ